MRHFFKVNMRRFDINDSNPIPMPPPVENTLMQLQSPNFNNNNNSNNSNNHSIFNGNGINAVPSNPTLHPASVINLTNSSDVVIGPMTQYQGSVTIYQYMDATVQRAISNTGHPHAGMSI